MKKGKEMHDKQTAGFSAYVQHGTGSDGPFITERAPTRYRQRPLGKIKKGPIATHWQIKTAGRWRTLYASSGNPANFVIIDRKRTPVQIVTTKD